MKTIITIDTDTHAVVPREPTIAMLDAANDGGSRVIDRAKYNAMLAAAPPIPETGGLLCEARDMLADLGKGESCDHSVGICWCGYFDLMERLNDALPSPPAGDDHG